MTSTQPLYPPHFTIPRAVVSMAIPFIGGLSNTATTTVAVTEGWVMSSNYVLSEDDIDAADAHLAMQDAGGITLADLKAKYGP